MNIVTLIQLCPLLCRLSQVCIGSAALLFGALSGVANGQTTPNANSDAYLVASAHAPDFDNKEAWPDLSGKERFLAVQWPKGRVMEWAHPGNGGGVRVRNGLDLWDPANWLLDGQPCEEVIFDENTDIVLPPADKHYVVNTHEVPGWEPVYRHVTIGKNAALGNNHTKYYGNVWVKAGGSIGGSHSNSYLGKDTFFRYDNDHDPSNPALFSRNDGEAIYPKFVFGQYLSLDKETPETSMELLGGFSALDRVSINRGILIIGEGGRFSNGRNASLFILEEGTLALLDNAVLMKWCNQIGQLDFTVFGILQGGLPERPLRRPAFVGLSYQNTTGVRFFDRLKVPDGQHPGNPIKKLETRVASLIVEETGTVKSFSATPEGVLHLRFAGMDANDWHLRGDAGYREWVESLTPEEKAYLEKQLGAIPKKVTALFRAGSKVDGLVFNDFHAGGILIENPDEPKAWKNVSFGTGNEATGDALFSTVSEVKVTRHIKGSGGTYLLPGEEPAAE